VALLVLAILQINKGDNMREIALVKDQLKVKVGDKIIELDGKDCSDVIKTIIESSLDLWIFEIEVSTYKTEEYISISVELVGFVDLIGYADSYQEFILRIGIDECRGYKNDLDKLEHILNKIISFIKEINEWIEQVRKNKKTVKYKLPLYSDEFKLEVKLTLHYEKYGDGLYDTKVHKYYLETKVNGKIVPSNAIDIIKEALKNIEPYKIKFSNIVCPLLIAPDGAKKQLYVSEPRSEVFIPCDTWDVETWEKEAYAYFHDVSACIKDVFFWIEAKESKKYLDAWK